MFRIFIASFGVLFLSGCFFKQQPPATNQLAQQSVITGNVILEDLTISNQGALATIQAAFYKKANKQTEPVNAFVEPLRFGSMAQSGSRTPQCESGKMKRQPESRASETPIRIGNVFFGPALQDNLMRLDIGSNNLYQAILREGLAAGAYQVVAEGTESIAPMSEILSMPEALDWVRVNGIDFGQPIVEYKKGEDLELSWKEASFPNSENRILIAFTGRTDLETFYVVCESEESNLMPVKGLNTWTIDRSLFTELPSKATLTIQLTRGHVIQAQRKSSLIRLQGLRTLYQKIDFIE